MLHGLADESERHGVKVNNLKTKVMMEKTHQYMSTILKSRKVKAMSTWDRDTAPGTKTKTRRFKEESRPDGQHSPSTASSSRVTLEHACRDKFTTDAYFQQ